MVDKYIPKVYRYNQYPNLNIIYWDILNKCTNIKAFMTRQNQDILLTFKNLLYKSLKYVDFLKLNNYWIKNKLY